MRNGGERQAKTKARADGSRSIDIYQEKTGGVTYYNFLGCISIIFWIGTGRPYYGRLRYSEGRWMVEEEK